MDAVTACLHATVALPPSVEARRCCMTVLAIFTRSNCRVDHQHNYQLFGIHDEAAPHCFACEGGSWSAAAAPYCSEEHLLHQTDASERVITRCSNTNVGALIAAVLPNPSRMPQFTVAFLAERSPAPLGHSSGQLCSCV
jgi:hypothetical protein